MSSPELAVRTLCGCLSCAVQPSQNLALRRQLNGGMWGDVLEAAANHGLSGALGEAIARRGLAAGIPDLRLANGQATVPQVLAEALTQHRANREAKLVRLVELTLLLNRHGMEPLLLKGARSLWTGSPQWRAMGDLDLLVPGRAGEAQRLAQSIGYTSIAGYENPPDWHHEINLYRKDLPGWLEFHDRAAMYRADVLLPTPMLLEQSMSVVGHAGAVARVLPIPLDVLYCVVHNHISHRGDKFGILSLKGLYEFTTGVDAMGEPERVALLAIARTHPRLLVMLDLWLAAANERLALPVLPPLVLAEDAVRRWQKIDGRETRQGNYDGLLDEISMALSSQRLRRMNGGRTWWGRQKLRAAAARALLAPATISAA